MRRISISVQYCRSEKSIQLAAQQESNQSDHSSKSKLKKKRSSTYTYVHTVGHVGLGSLDPSDTGSYRSNIPESMTINAPLGPLPSVSSGNSMSARSGVKSRTSSKAACNTCEHTTTRLLALEADFEYLRSAALNIEYVCLSCEQRTNNPHMNSASSVTSRRSVKSNRSRHSNSSGRILESSAHSARTKSRKSRPESCQRLIDVTSRHKRQIEHMSREMARWKNEMHLKLSKLAMMCKDLNDEYAKRKELVEVAKEDLSDVREERNTLSSELDILRARVALYEKQELENVEIRRLLCENENETLSIADQAILERDAMIEDLTTRLTKSMDLLDTVKAQNLQQKT